MTVVGMGTGRCGTQSLASLLGVPHQGHICDWDDVKTLDVDFLKENGGDVGSYYIRYVLLINEQIENVKFVCLKRGKEETVKSFLENIVENPFEKTFMPTYKEIESLEDRVEKYYDEYYRLAEFMEQKYENFRVFSMEDLNNGEILKWLGREEKEAEKITGTCEIFK